MKVDRFGPITHAALSVGIWLVLAGASDITGVSSWWVATVCGAPSEAASVLEYLKCERTAAFQRYAFLFVVMTFTVASLQLIFRKRP